jgi:hypothetical protein
MRFFYLAATMLGLVSSAAAQGPAASEPTEPLAATTTPATPAPLGIKSSKILGLPARVKLLPIPVVFYQEETGLGYGLGLLLSGPLGKDVSDTTTRSSLVRAQYWTTTESQSLLQLTHTVYTPGEKFYLAGEVSAYDLGLFYYGVGNDNKKANESEQKYKLFIVNQRVQGRIAKDLFVGAQYRLTDISDIRYDKAAENGGPNYFALDPRVDERERRGTTVSGLGPALTYDSRDVALASYTGSYVDLGVTINGKGLGSDFNFTRYQLDARHFRPLFGSTKTILALHALGQFHSGDVPFRELGGIGANLGGTLYNSANVMRGIYEQRFRDRQLAVVEAELRQYLFWRFDVAAFGGIGETAYSFKDFSGDGIKGAGGLGVRFHFIRPVENGVNRHFQRSRANRVNLRLDYAVGTDSPAALYFAIGEAF